MVDNTQIQKPSVGGDIISTEDIGDNIKIPRTKIVLGSHGVDGEDIGADNPLPVEGRVILTDGSEEDIGADNPLPVEGRVILTDGSEEDIGADNPLPVEGRVTLADGGEVDSFSRLRTSNPTYVFDSQFTYNLHPLLFENITNGSGASVAFDSTNRCALMTFSSTSTGGMAFMQSYEHFRYQPGRSQLIFITFNMFGGVSNVLKFAGYSDGTNGVEFQLNGTTAQFVIYSGTTAGNQIAVQSNWNLDKLDGTGISGITIDFTKTQILIIDVQALYVGRVRVGFDINGLVYYVHEFRNTNNLSYPYIQSANLPIRCGMTCTGTVSTTINFVCCSVLSEGGNTDNIGYTFSFNNSITALNGARTLLMNVRPKTTFNSITNRIKFILESINICTTGQNAVYWEICLGQTITGTTTFSDVNTNYSSVEYNTAGTLSGNPLIVLASGYTPQANGGASNYPISIRYPISLNAAGIARSLGTLTVLCSGVGGNSAMNGALNWREVR